MEAGERHATRAFARFAALAAVVLSLSLAVAIVSACLPDLAPIGSAIEDSGPPVKVRGCGDGIIATLDDGGDAGESCDPGEAGAKGCTPDCRIACEDGRNGTIDPDTGHCYFSIGPRTKYSEAEDECRRAGAHVVTIGSFHESTVVDGVADGGYFVGLVYEPSVKQAYQSAANDEPGYPGFPFTGPCAGCFGLGVDPSSDSGGIPLSPLADQSAAAPCVMSRQGRWETVQCVGGKLPIDVVCEREPAGRRIDSCSGGYCFSLAFTSKEGKSYVLDVASSTADQARAACAQYGAEPVVLGSREEREALAHEILQLFSADSELTFWIGASQDAGAWSWEDGDPLVPDASRPLPWGDRQPATGVRAYMRLLSSAYDTQLAYAGSAEEKRPTLCARRP